LYFYSGPTRDQAKRVAWERLKLLIPPNWIEDISESELVIKTIFQSRLYLFGMDAPQRIEGNQWDGGVIDENSDIKPGTFRKSVLPALIHKLGWCWRIGIPKRQGIGAVEFRENVELALAGKLDDAEVFTWPSSDIVDEKVLLAARSHMSEKDFNEQFNATFETSGGGIFYAFDKSNIRECVYNQHKRIIVGSDFNVCPMAWVLCHRYENHLEVFDEIWIKDTNTYQTLDYLYSKYGTHKGGFIFIGDAAGKQRHSSATHSDYTIIFNDKRFQALGRNITYPDSNPPVEDRYSATNTLFCNANHDRRCFVDINRCPNLIRDLQTRAYKPGTREPDNSNKDSGHPTDALGYVIWQLYPMQLQLAQAMGAGNGVKFHIPQPVGTSNF
jgi:hypothetical protein